MRTLYRASRVLTLTHPPAGEWILVDGRHVQRVGSGEPPEAERVVDLPGATIIPGFVDAHVHLTWTGLQHASPEAAAARSARELTDLLAKLAAERDEPLMVLGYDESKWVHPQLPDLDSLDAVTSHPLLACRADGHVSLANAAALEISGVLDGPGIERGADDRPTGVVTREANDRIQRWFHERLSDREIQGHQLRAAALAASRGVTSVHEMSTPAGHGLRDIETLLGHLARLPVDVVIYLATTDIPQVIDLGLSGIGGDLAIDGSIGARTAHLSQPYVDAEDTGVGYLEDDELAEFFHGGHLAGLQVAVHAIGDAAIERVLSTWERVYRALDSRGRRHLRARRHRIEHFEMPSDPQIEWAAALGLALSVQPAFDAEWGRPGGLYEQRLGEERATGMNPFRSFLDRGLEVGAGSDSPITDLDPMAGIEALQHHHDVTQRLSRAEAIRLFTAGGARLAGQEDKKGRLEPGAHADFVAFDDDPATTDAIGDLRPILTVSLGREVFAA